MNTLKDALALDAADPLHKLRSLFSLPSELIYLDGNSLGALPTATAQRVAQTVTQEWGQGLIRSWNSAGWIDMPQRVGDKIAPLIGAHAGEVVCADSTSVNLFKLLSAAILIAARAYSISSNSLNHDKKYLISERSNFPTDLYIAQSLCAQHGLTLRLIDEASQLDGALDNDVAVMLLTHVHYRTGAMHDMGALTAKAHAVGALAVWDLSHSAGAVPVDVHAAQADMAVGCGYKYLNGGPGAPAFMWVHPRHVNACVQPLSGWMGHAAPFDFLPDYTPAQGISHFLCGTPSVIGMAALDCGLDTLEAAQSLGGMAALRKKSLALTDLFRELIEQRCAGMGLRCITPPAPQQRGSQLSYVCEQNGYAVMQALIARGVIGDFRAGADGDILRFGFAPLYVRFVDVWNAVEHLHQVLVSEQWREARFNTRKAVT